jgi:hypothetical protein
MTRRLTLCKSRRFQRQFPEKERLEGMVFGTLEFLAQGLIVF